MRLEGLHLFRQGGARGATDPWYWFVLGEVNNTVFTSKIHGPITDGLNAEILSFDQYRTWQLEPFFNDPSLIIFYGYPTRIHGVLYYVSLFFESFTGILKSSYIAEYYQDKWNPGKNGFPRASVFIQEQGFIPCVFTPPGGGEGEGGGGGGGGGGGEGGGPGPGPGPGPQPPPYPTIPDHIVYPAPCFQPWDNDLVGAQLPNGQIPVIRKLPGTATIYKLWFSQSGSIMRAAGPYNENAATRPNFMVWFDPQGRMTEAHMSHVTNGTEGTNFWKALPSDPNAPLEFLSFGTPPLPAENFNSLATDTTYRTCQEQLPPPTRPAIDPGLFSALIAKPCTVVSDLIRQPSAQTNWLTQVVRTIGTRRYLLEFNGNLNLIHARGPQYPGTNDPFIQLALDPNTGNLTEHRSDILLNGQWGHGIWTVRTNGTWQYNGWNVGRQTRELNVPGGFEACQTPQQDQPPVRPPVDNALVNLLKAPPCSPANLSDLIYQEGNVTFVIRTIAGKRYKLQFGPEGMHLAEATGPMYPGNMNEAVQKYIFNSAGTMVYHFSDVLLANGQWSSVTWQFFPQNNTWRAQPTEMEGKPPLMREIHVPIAFKPCQSPPPPETPEVDTELMRVLSLPPCSPETQNDRVHGPSDYSGGATYIIRETNVGKFWIENFANGSRRIIGPYKTGAHVLFDTTILGNGQTGGIKWRNAEGKVEHWSQPFGGGAMRLEKTTTELIGGAYEGLPGRLEEMAPEWRSCQTPPPALPPWVWDEDFVDYITQPPCGIVGDLVVKSGSRREGKDVYSILYRLVPGHTDRYLKMFLHNDHSIMHLKTPSEINNMGSGSYVHGWREGESLRGLYPARYYEAINGGAKEYTFDTTSGEVTNYREVISDSVQNTFQLTPQWLNGEHIDPQRNTYGPAVVCPVTEILIPQQPPVVPPVTEILIPQQPSAGPIIRTYIPSTSNTPTFVDDGTPYGYYTDSNGDILDWVEDDSGTGSGYYVNERGIVVAHCSGPDAKTIVEPYTPISSEYCNC